MSSDQPYTPDEHDVRSVYVDYYMQHTGKLHSEADAEFQRFIGRVRRDAAREAVGTLGTDLMQAARDYAKDGDHSAAGAWRNAAAHAHHLRDTHHPEETPDA